MFYTLRKLLKFTLPTRSGIPTINYFHQFIVIFCVLTEPILSYCDTKKTEAVEILQRALGVNGPFTTKLLTGGFSGSEVIKMFLIRLT